MNSIVRGHQDEVRDFEVAVCGTYDRTIETFLTALFRKALRAVAPEKNVPKISHVKVEELLEGATRWRGLIVAVFNPSIHYPSAKSATPLVDGPDFVHAVHQRHRLPVMVITNERKYPLADVDKFVASGAIRCVGMPFDYSDIETVLRSIIQRDE
ncbi:MAG TPA: hypothetical protein VL069_03625 [Opitutus sp.]|nr:hypothetical protein [Opitutus sp.]